MACGASRLKLYHAPTGFAACTHGQRETPARLEGPGDVALPRDVQLLMKNPCPTAGAGVEAAQQALASESSAAAPPITDLEIEAANRPPPPPPDLTAAAFFDVDNTLVHGSSLVHFARQSGRPQVLHLRRFGPLRLRAGQVSASSAARTATTWPRAGARRWRSSRAAPPAELEAVGEEIYDEIIAEQDLAGHPCAGADAPRRGPAGVARHRDALRAGCHDRQAAGADRCARHGRRVGRRGVHRPAGRRHPARHRQGARRCGRWPSAKG